MNLKKTVKKLKLKSRKNNYDLKIKNYTQLKNNMAGTKNYKEEFIEILKQLEYYNKVHEKAYFKAKIYKEGIENIKNLNNNINSSKDIEKLPNVGKAIKDKLDEYIRTGKVKNVEELKKKYGTDDYIKEKLKQEKKEVFLKIHGIGDAAAEKIIELGITNIEELKKRKDEEIQGKGKNKIKLLNETQQKGLEYYDDILKRIPRKEIEDYKKIIDEEFKKLSNNDIENNKLEIVGSYRRGKEDSGDIDIIITSKLDDKSIFDKLLDSLKENNIIKVFLSRGEKKSMVITKLNDNSVARRIDFLYTPPDEYAFAILYFTGSKEFNTSMRQYSLNNNLTLNEHGFHTMKNKKKEEKINSISFATEKDIFDYLNLEYKEPHERKDEKSIVIKNNDTIKLKILKTKNDTIKKLSKDKEEKIIKNNIEKFKLEGIIVLKSLGEKELTDMLKETIQKYYQETEESLLSDNQYDILREYVLKKYPNNKTANIQHGEVILDKNKVKLPYEMWSMDKIKADTKELEKFKSKYRGPYVISCKLDGVSGLYSREENKKKLYTRGDGKFGQNIDHLIEYLNLPTEENITIRGELIIKEKLFEEKYSLKYSNSRNFISGLVNKKKLTNEDINILKDIDFVGYEVIKPENLKPSEQLKFLSLKTNCVKFIDSINSEKLTNEFLSEKLVDWRKNYEYNIDGIICIDDKVYSRESKNPGHAFAFKMVLSDQSAEAKVLDVLWSASKDGFLKPRVQIEEVNIGGAKINYATGFNAKYIEDNKIGVGAVIKIIRSGDVIPKIEEVITNAETPLMPKEKYIWNETHVDIMLENKEDDKTVKLKNIAGFFKTLDVEGLGEGNIKKIIEAGGNSISKIITMTISDLMKVEGFKEKMATKIYNSIQKQLEKASLTTIAAGSNIFGRGFGEKRISIILKNEPNIITEELSKNEKINKLKNIDGLGLKTASLFVEKIEEFKEFLFEAKLEYKLTKESSKKEISPKKELSLANKIIVLSDIKGKKEISEKIEKLGGEVVGNINKNVNLLIVGSLDNETSKIKKAKEYNIEIISIEKFNNIY
tara:strand:+ start:4906 stop:8070 length:3165 start_codon:yes stop_codon:yes gene_type:complete